MLEYPGPLPTPQPSKVQWLRALAVESHSDCLDSAVRLSQLFDLGKVTFDDLISLTRTVILS